MSLLLAFRSAVGTNADGAYSILAAVGSDASGDYAVLDAVGADAVGGYSIVGQQAANLSGGLYTVRVGKRRFKVDPLDPSTLKRVIEQIQDEAEEAAQVVAPVVTPASVAKQEVRVIEAPNLPKETAAEFARFMAQIRGEYESAVRTALLIRLMKLQEDDDEEALLLML